MPLRELIQTPQVKLEYIYENDLPEIAKEHLELMVRAYRDDDSPVVTFDNYFMVNHDNGVTTYVASHVQVHHETYNDIERHFQFIDISANNEVVGEAELRVALDERYLQPVNKPFVGWFYTQEKYRGNRQGNLIGRLLAMREVAISELDSPLYSGTLFTKEGLRLGKCLARLGFAEIIYERGMMMFRSIDPESQEQA